MLQFRRQLGGFREAVTEQEQPKAILCERPKPLSIRQIGIAMCSSGGPANSSSRAAHHVERPDKVEFAGSEFEIEFADIVAIYQLHRCGLLQADP